MEIIEVTSKKLWKDFLKLPNEIYADSPKYVPPLNLHMKMMVGKLGRPKKHLLLAKVNGEIIARVGFKVHIYKGETSLNFGFFECKEGHKEALKNFVAWGREKYPDLPIKGPYHFRMEDPYIGVLVEGYEKDPYFLMSYSKPYYDEYIKEAGFNQVMDLLTYQVRQDVSLENIMPHSRKAMSEHGVTIRTLDKSKLRKEAEAIARIFNSALADNWGFEEFGKEQVDEMVALLKVFIDPRVVAFAVKDGKEIGCLIMIPNYNPILKTKTGRLSIGTLLGFMKNRRKMNSIRGYALGVMPKYHGMGIGSLLTTEMFRIGGEVGYHFCEISWVLESNGPMNELSKAMGGQHDKVYRVYELPTNSVTPPA